MLWQLNLLIIKELFVGKWDSDFQIFIWEWQYSFSQDIFGTNADTEGLLPTTVTLENKMLLPIFTDSINLDSVYSQPQNYQQWQPSLSFLYESLFFFFYK